MFQTAHRIYTVLDEITADPDHVVLIAAHNGLARIIQSYFHEMTNEEFASFGIANCEIRRFDF
jgi:probable phosphoglycerate mutase